jgi:hypothetical protein
LMDAPPRARSVMSEETGEVRPGLLVVDASGLVPGAVRHRLEQALREVRHEGLGCVPPAQL